MSQITTRVTDTTLGRAAVGVPVALEQQIDRVWTPLAVAATDARGRVDSLGADELRPGRYRLTLDTASYFASTGRIGFFPEIVIVVVVAGGEPHHLPVLLSPFGYTTYRE